MVVQELKMEEAMFKNRNLDAGNMESHCEVHAGFSAEWKSRLQSHIRDLEILNRETEKDYLEIGSNLKQFHIQSRDIVNVSSSISGSMAGAEIIEAISKLQGAIQRTETYIEGFEDRLGNRKDVLKEALEMVENMDEPVHDLKGIIKNMKYLSLSTKIHSARINEESSDFMVLAEDIKKLSEIIESKSAEIKSNLSALRNILDHAISSIIEIQKNQSHRLKKILVETFTIINSLQGKHELSKEKAESISRLSNGISGNIGEIVESVQFHDITRQQFDHVGEALAQLINTIDGEPDPGSREGSGLITHVRDVCDLQLTQIDHAREQLITSMRRIVDSLETVSGNANLMLDEARQIAEYGDQKDRSFMYEMERSLVSASSTLLALSDNVESNLELSETMARVDSTANQMTSFTDDMDEIESEIEVIALNASVKAAKIGDSGLALGVVAQMMQKVSVKAHVITATISQFINTIKLAVKVLSSQIDSDEDNKETEDISNDLSETLRFLRKVNDDINENLVRVSEKGDVLSTSIRESISNIREHDLSGKVLDRVIGGLKGIVDEATQYTQGGEKVDTVGLLSGLSKHYSMKSEHAIHRTFVFSRGNGESHKTGDITESDPDEESQRSKNEFGDNVELF
jgi:methyl-accepting chemotaxis protein